MPAIFECERCGVVTGAGEQVCEARQVEHRNAYCGTAPETGAMCPEIKAHLAYVCGSCGRPAAQAGLLCDPLLTG